MTKLMEYLDKQSKPFVIALGLALVLLIGIVDYVTGPELALSIFYLIPVSLGTWFAGRRAGIVISFAGAVSWFAAAVLADPPRLSTIFTYWNAAVDGGSFLIVAYGLSALRATMDRREELMEFIVHDLRAPLSNTITGLDALQSFGLEGPVETARSLVDLCRISCDWMLTLINSLLDLARLESSQLPLQVSQVDVKNLVQLAFVQVALAAQRKQVTLTPQLETESECVAADQAMTVRVLVNLLGNAIKFSKFESAVIVRVAPAEANQVAFSVIDCGPGIPKEWTAQVFDKYAQVEVRKAGGAVGSGLGLTFCRLAVEAQHGRIWIESDVGEGTIVTFTLPMRTR